MLLRLERRALRIQLEHFKIPPERRGRKFYALELAGEAGELLNGCKKFMRTKLAHRRDKHVREEIPEEAADALIALMMLKHSMRDARLAQPAIPACPARRSIAWLHTRLSELALDTAELYRAAIGDPAGTAFDLDRYTHVVELLLGVASFFGFDLERAAQRKLTAIITKVAAGYYK